MVLFEFNKIIRNKYNYYKKKFPDKVKDTSQDEFYLIGLEKISHLFPFYFSGITEKYIEKVISNKSNKIVVSCLTDKFDINNITGILIYHKTKLTNITKYYILILGTHERFRNYGYGKVLLDEFINFIQNKNDKNIGIAKVLLKSVESSINFYINYGFTQIKPDEICTNKLFYKYEKTSEIKNYPDKILEYIVAKQNLE